jgi:ADP-ribose pyrophosphatase YjhB (NUDIX family)
VAPRSLRAMSPARRSARVLVTDPDGRLLMLRLLLDPADLTRGFLWITPGARLRAGESPAAAAARGLREDVALDVGPAALTGPVARTAGFGPLGPAVHEDFFWYAVSRREVDACGLAPAPPGVVAGHRWWDAEDLATAAANVVPWGVAPLVSRLTAGEVPATPVALPWHR